MKTLKTLIASTVLAAGLATGPNASALAINDAYYVGSISPGTPAGDDAEWRYVAYLIELFNGTQTDFTQVEFPEVNANAEQDFTLTSGALTGPLPGGITGEADREDPTDGSFDISGVTYILGKYGNGLSHVWYVGDLTGIQSIPTSVQTGVNPGNGRPQFTGLSHLSVFGSRETKVPDAGTSVLLLGAGLLGIGALRRRLAK